MLAVSSIAQRYYFRLFTVCWRVIENIRRKEFICSGDCTSVGNGSDEGCESWKNRRKKGEKRILGNSFGWKGSFEGKKQ